MNENRWTKPTSLALTSQERAELQRLAALAGKSRSALVREWIEQAAEDRNDVQPRRRNDEPTETREAR